MLAYLVLLVLLSLLLLLHYLLRPRPLRIQRRPRWTLDLTHLRRSPRRSI